LFLFLAVTYVWDRNLGGLKAYFLCEGQDPH